MIVLFWPQRPYHCNLLISSLKAEHRMQRALTGAVLFLLVSGCAVVDAHRVRQMSSIELKEAFQPCVSPLGVSGEVAQRKTAQLPEGRLTLIPLFRTTLVSDGYVHYLHIDRERGQVYLTQVGGYGGMRTVYGPLRLRSSCAMSTAHS